MNALSVCLIFGLISVLSGCTGDGDPSGCRAEMPCFHFTVKAPAARLPDAGVADMDTADPPPDLQLEDPLLSQLTVSAGALRPRFSPRTTMYTLQTPAGVDTLQVTPTALDASASVAVNGSPIASGAASSAISIGSGVTMIAITVQRAGAMRSYSIAVTRSPLQYFKASNSGTQDSFGSSIALSGDTLVVGAPGEASSARGIGGNQADNSAPSSGAVYVFRWSGAVWMQEAYLKSSNSDPYDNFGNQVALSGDTLAVAAGWEGSSATGIGGDQNNNDAPFSGAVYVFVRSGSTWTQQAYIKASNTETNDWFGYSLALSGDTLAVGALQEASAATGVGGDQSNNGEPFSGAVYVFVRSGTAWTQQAYLKASNTEAYDFFGATVALRGDTLAVGAIWEDSSATGINGDSTNNGTQDSGAVFVFVRSGTTWTQQAYLKASNPEFEDYFGTELSLDGDTLAVAATGEDSSATSVNGNQTNNGEADSGAVYVFVRSGTTWTQQAYLKAFNTRTSNIFGSGLSLSGDILAVGAYYEDSDAIGANGNQADVNAGLSGAVYIFTRIGTSWAPHTYLKSSNTEASDWFGGSVALFGTSVAVGAVGEDSKATGINGNQADNSASRSGAVYLYGF